MKDRFQYRAKDVKTGEWRYGYYTELPCGLGSSGVNGEYADTDAFILNYTKKQSALYSNAEPHEVVVGEQYKIDKKTLSQCTGLKDKNGKMIYEGDIVNVFVDSIKPHYIPHVVIWDRKEWQLAQQNKNYKKCENCANRNKTKCSYCKEYFMSSAHTNFKDFYNGFVIGNIYENPELLEEQ